MSIFKRKESDQQGKRDDKDVKRIPWTYMHGGNVYRINTDDTVDVYYVSGKSRRFSNISEYFATTTE